MKLLEISLTQKSTRLGQVEHGKGRVGEDGVLVIVVKLDEEVEDEEEEVDATPSGSICNALSFVATTTTTMTTTTAMATRSNFKRAATHLTKRTATSR